MKVLIIGDTKTVPATVTSFLRSKSYCLEWASTPEDGCIFATDYEQSVIIVGFETSSDTMTSISSLRKKYKIKTPILVLAEHLVKHEVLTAFELGCDDYQMNTIDSEEAFTRINALVRRSNGQTTNIIEAGRIRIDINSRRVTVDGVATHIGGLPYRLLVLLCLKKNTVLTRSRIINELYHSEATPDYRLVDTQVKKLRDKLGIACNHIKSVRGEGYQLICD